jgi:hypothetical protein
MRRAFAPPLHPGGALVAQEERLGRILPAYADCEPVARKSQKGEEQHLHSSSPDPSCNKAVSTGLRSIDRNRRHGVAYGAAHFAILLPFRRKKGQCPRHILGERM